MTEFGAAMGCPAGWGLSSGHCRNLTLPLGAAVVVMLETRSSARTGRPDDPPDPRKRPVNQGPLQGHERLHGHAAATQWRCRRGSSFSSGAISEPRMYLIHKGGNRDHESRDRLAAIGAKGDLFGEMAVWRERRGQLRRGRPSIRRESSAGCCARK